MSPRAAGSGHCRQWWAHLVGAPQLTRINIELTILRKKIEDRHCRSR
jgi:hypothetical protein